MEQGKQKALIFALGGKLVRTSAAARTILRRAIREQQDWLIPQARSVARQLEAAEARGAA